MQDVITGALIAFVPSLIILIITTYAQWKQKLKDREWQVSDQQNALANQIISQRISELEGFIKELASTVGSTATEVAVLMNEKNRGDLYNSFNSLDKQLESLSHRLIYHASFARYLGRAISIEYRELSNQFNSAVNIFTEIWFDTNKSEPIFSEEKTKELAHKAYALSMIYADLLKSLDQMKLNNPAQLLEDRTVEY
jgi:hypothetical protein